MDQQTKRFRVGDLFEAAHVRKAHAIVLAASSASEAVDRIEREIVAERMPHIDRVTGQQNVPRYCAHVLYGAVVGAL